MLNKGLLFILSAPAGAGKTTLVRELQKKHPLVKKTISHTTREKRTDEIDGIDYHFVSDQKFEEMEKNGEFLEQVSLFRARYATSKKEIEEIVSKGMHAILVIDTKGFFLLKEKNVKMISIFITPPSIQELDERLSLRASESQEQKKERLEEAHYELSQAPYYDYIVENDTLEHAVEVLHSIVVAEEHKNSTEERVEYDRTVSL